MDVVGELGPVFLGSRLKRLGERLQAGAAVVIAEAGLPVAPAHMPLLTALDRGALTIGALVDAVGASQPGVTRGVGQLARMGLVETVPSRDGRQRRVALTAAGAAAMARTKLLVWPRVGAAVDAMLAGGAGPLLERLAALEAALAGRSLAERAGDVRVEPLRLRDYEDALADDFRSINAEWIEAMYRLEDVDRAVLDDPRGAILDGGGAILFVEAAGLGVVGTCALRRTGGAAVELTKMGVRASARGLKAGEFLLAAAIARGVAMGADPLYLLTNRRSEAAIHLYRKLGFAHDAGIMVRFGGRYGRCDVAMRYVG